MDNAIVYICAAAFFIAVFPVHVINYVYASTEKKYVSVNVTAYRLITLFNVNTDEKSEAADDDKDKKSGGARNRFSDWMRIYNSLCITKIVQLSDFGLQRELNAYAAFAQNAATNFLYSFVRINEGKTKLKNYTILNYEHGNINYYLKLSGIINVITMIKLIFIYYWGKLYEYKNKEKL